LKSKFDSGKVEYVREKIENRFKVCKEVLMLMSVKRVITLIMVLAFALSLAGIAYAGENMKGTIKEINAEKGTVVFCPKGTSENITMSVADNVDLSKFKVDSKVKIYIVEEEGNQMIKGMKPDKRKVIVGC